MNQPSRNLALRGASAVATIALLLALVGCGGGQRDSGGAAESRPFGAEWATDGLFPPSTERTPFRPPGSESRQLAPPAPGLDDLEWMVGCWSSYDSNTKVWIEECWSAIVGDMMLGTNRTVRGPRTAAFEQLRIEAHAEGVWYLASPGGRPATEFMRVTPTSLDRRGAEHVAVFENPENDFPQRIIYRGDGRTYLEAVIEGVVGEEETPDGTTRPREVRQSWRWVR